MAARESRSVALAVAVYRRCTVLLPWAFRARYGDRLTTCFAEIAADTRRSRGRLAVADVTVRALVDLAWRAISRRHVDQGDAPVRSWSPLRGLGTDARHTVRRLVRRPAFPLTAILMLGLGLGSATAVFSLVHGIVLAPLPYPEPDRLVEVDHAGPGVGATSGLGITYGFYRIYTQQVRGMEAWAMYAAAETTLLGRGEPLRLSGIRTTTSLGQVLRVPAQHGRWFTAAEGERGAAPAVVLSDRLWRERFGADPSIVGTHVDLGGVPHEVVGVMPATFAFPSAETRFWLPRAVPNTGIGGWNEQAIARLAQGVTPDAVARAVVARYPALRETTDDPARVRAYLDEARVVPIVRPLQESVVAGVQATLWILLATVGAVLGIAVANVANLFLIRAEDGRRELAVKNALGAGQARLVRAAMIEGFVVAGAAGAIGVAAAAAAIRTVQAASPIPVPRLGEVGLSAPVLGAAAIATLLTGLVLGLLPFVGPRQARWSMANHARTATADRSSRRWRDVLVAGQVALALLLLIGSGLLVRTYRELRAVDLGFGERQALVFDLGLPETRYRTRAEAARLHEALVESLRRVPGVRAAAAVGHCLPLVGNMCGGEALEVEGRPSPDGVIPPITGARVATPDYFATMGIRVRGRTFTPADTRGQARVAILSEAAAAAYLPDRDSIGRRVRFGHDAPWHTIVGVASDVRGRLDTDRFSRVIYLPVLEAGTDGPTPARMSYVIATAVPPTSIAPAVRDVVAALDPMLPLADLRTLGEHIGRATAPTGFALAVIGLAAAIALVLGIVGIYAAVASVVSERTAEIGVRLAIGATPADVRRLVMREGGLVVVAGTGLGLVAAVGLGRFADGLLFGITATDPQTLVSLTIAMLAAAAAALALPARRASRIEPSVTIRRD